MSLPDKQMGFLQQMSSIHGIPINELTAFYEKNLNDPQHVVMWSNMEERLAYIDMLIGGYVQEFNSAVMEELDLFVVYSTNPRESKNSGQLVNQIIGITKRPAEARPKFLKIMNLEETGVIQRLNSLSTGTINVNIQKETETTIEAFSRSQTVFKAKTLEWLKDDAGNVCNTDIQKWLWLKKRIKTIEIAEAGKWISAKDEKGYAVFNDLRIISGFVATRRITKKIDEETKKERQTGILTLTDKSILNNHDFFVNKEIVDPKDATKKKMQYGGFSVFVEPVDIENIGKGSVVDLLGHISGPQNMNASYIHPILIKAPLKPTDRIQKQAAVSPGTAGIPAGAVSPVSL